jgi:hypothetical protein
MAVDQRTDAILAGLHAAGIEFVGSGGMAAVLQGAAILTEDLDIVHRRTHENVARLLAWLLEHDAYDRFDLANGRLPPKEDALLGSGHINLKLDLGKLDVRCELGPGEGYDESLAETLVLDRDAFPLRVLAPPRLIAVKSAAGRPKDRAVLPVLVAALDEQRRRKT